MSVEIFSDSNSSITLPVCDQCGWCEGDYMYTNTFSSCGQLQLDDPINWLWGCPESQNCCARVPDAYAGFVMPQIDPLYLSDYENQVPFCSDMPWQGTTYLGICEENNADGSCGEVGPCNDGSEPDICGFCFGEGMGYNMTLTNCTYEASVNDQWFKTCPLSEPCCGAVSFLGLGPYSDESTPFCSSFTLDGVDYSGVCYKPDVCGICGGDNTSCFLGDNSLQDGYFGPINAPSGASGFDGIPWQPQLIDNSLNVFYDYGVLYDPFNPDECTFPVLGGYDTVILNDWSLHVQSDKCRGVGYTPGSQHAITGGITIYNEFSQKQKVITLDGVYSSSKYYNGNLTTDLAQNSTDLDYLRNMNNHHSVWPMQNGNFLLMGTHKISYTDWEILGGTDIENLTGTDDDMFEPGFFIEVKPDNIEDCTQDESGFFICDSSIVFEWYMVDHFVQDTLSNADACSSYPYMEEESGCYAPTAEIYKYPHMLNINIPKEGQFDWAHLNTIHYTPSEGDGGFCPELDGCFVISSRTIGLGEFYVIGKTSGKIIWRCCNSENYNREQNPAVKTHAQHGVNWIPPGYPGEGNLIFLNNKHYYKKCIDITDPDECNSCSVDGFGHSNAYCYWVQGDGYPGSDGAGACLDGGGEYTDDCNRSAIVEIKPNYDISQDSSVPFLYDEIFIMDRIYGTFPSYYNNNNITLNTNDFSNSWSAEAEGGVFKMPNGNIFVSSQSQLEKFEVSDPYGVPQLMAMIPGNLPDYGQDPNNNSAVHGRSFKVIPTCTDPTADNYDPASEYMYHVDDGSCVGGESGTSTGAAVGITEFFLEPQSAEIPQWIELTNFSGAEVDIQGWTIQTIDNVSGGGGFAEQGTYTITPVIGGNTLLRTDNFSKFICDSDGEVFINPYICENHCGAECTNLTEGSRYLIISDTADNYNGIFADILSNEVDFTGTDFSATEKDANIGWSGFQLPTTSQLSSYFADDCPLDPTVDQSTGYHIVLRNHLGQTVHHLCIDAQFPDGWYSSTSPGHSYSYVTQAGFQNINDQFYWRGLNHSEYIQHGMFGLRSGGTDYSYYFNDILMDVGIMLFGEDPYNPITSPPYFGNFNKGTPLDTEIYNLMGEMFYDNCRDFNAYNYMCNPGQSGFDTPACPYGPSTTNPLPNWICGDEEDGLPYGTCCQYIVEIGCTQPQVDFQGELFPVNYHCTEEMLGDDLLDFCETLDGGETYIPRGGCSVFVCQSNMTRACDNLVHIGDGNYTSNNCTEWGDGNNINCVSISVDCVTDGSYPEEWNGIAATWCQYPVVLHFDSETVDQSSQTIDINIWNSIPIEGIDDIIITGMRADSLTLSSKLAGWTHNISVEPEEPNGSIPVTTITVDKGAAPSLTPVDDWGSLPDGSKWDCVVATYINNSIICDTSDTIITLHYLIEEEDISSNMTIGFNDNNVSITIPTIFDQPEPIDIYADKVITQSIVNLDCNGHPYIPFDEYQETVMDECGECVIPVYVNGFEIFGLDYAGMQATGTNGCWYSETGTADGGCLTDCDCCGCDGIPGSTEELDECGICGGDGIDDGACDCDGMWLW